MRASTGADMSGKDRFVERARNQSPSGYRWLPPLGEWQVGFQMGMRRCLSIDECCENSASSGCDHKPGTPNPTQLKQCNFLTPPPLQTTSPTFWRHESFPPGRLDKKVHAQLESNRSENQTASKKTIIPKQSHTSFQNISTVKFFEMAHCKSRRRPI